MWLKPAGTALVQKPWLASDGIERHPCTVHRIVHGDRILAPGGRLRSHYSGWCLVEVDSRN